MERRETGRERKGLERHPAEHLSRVPSSAFLGQGKLLLSLVEVMSVEGRLSFQESREPTGRAAGRPLPLRALDWGSGPVSQTFPHWWICSAQAPPASTPDSLPLCLSGNLPRASSDPVPSGPAGFSTPSSLSWASQTLAHPPHPLGGRLAFPAS